MKLEAATQIANQVKKELAPFCDRIEIAGSIRRKKPEVKDIEIVAIPKPYDVGLFETGIATIINRWEKVKGDLPCKYTQRIHPSGIKIDLFFADHLNWGIIFAVRTGSAEFSHKRLACGWVAKGYKSENGYLCREGTRIPVPEEETLFNLIGLKYQEPETRTID